MADFLSPRIRARARAIQAVNPSIEEGDSFSPVPRSHAGHKRKFSSGDLLNEAELEGADIDPLVNGEASSVLAMQLRYESWREWTLAFLLLFFSAALAALVLENALHAILRVDNQDSIGLNLKLPDTSSSRTSNAASFVQGDVAFSRGDEDLRRGADSTSENRKPPISTDPPGKPMEEPLRRYPMIGRSILAKFGGLDPNGLPGHRELDEDGDMVELESPPEPLNKSRRWPTILYIPEGRASPKGPSSSSRKASAPSRAEPPIICGPSHPSGRACRFLFPLRMAEQESKARIHFMQVAELARRLDRILVLPNVGKSRMGACYKHPFETYYDVSSFFGGAPTLRPESTDAGYVTLGDFRLWSEAQKKPIRSRLLSVAASVTQEVLDTAEECLDDTDTDLVVHRYPTDVARETEYPGCFPSKWAHLELEETSMFVALESQTQRPSVVAPLDFGELLANNVDRPTADILARTFINRPNEEQELLQDFEVENTASDPDVLVLNWDLRRPVFPPTPSDISLRYSPELQDLATKLAPSSPYLAIHWRMETVDTDVLEDCAHALVDALSNILHDTGHLGLGVRQVWFASDYPYPVASLCDGSHSPSPAGSVAKSGTFKTFGEQHEAAVGILASAFQDGEDLDRWELVDISRSISMHEATESVENRDLLRDAGVLGILDKMVASRANLFVSGSRRCSRSSSFTRQVIESRQANWKELRNVVSVF